jgi:hypothetical protein
MPICPTELLQWETSTDVRRPACSVLIDSGAGAMVYSDSALFVDMRISDGPFAVYFGKQKVLPVAAVGTIAFLPSVLLRRPIPFYLKNVLYVPDAGPGLYIISAHCVHVRGHGANFDHPPGYERRTTANGHVSQTCTSIDNVSFVHITPMPCPSGVLIPMLLLCAVPFLLPLPT